MTKGGQRPGAGRPKGTTSTDKRTVQKMVRFTIPEWESVKAASIKYGGRETDFMRDAILSSAQEFGPSSAHRGPVKP